MRRIEKLILQARRVSDNEEFDNDPSNPLGIIDDEVVEYINEAQENLQSTISLKHKKVFITIIKINLEAEEEKYALPKDLFLDGRIVHLEALFNNRVDDYYTLDQRHVKERLPNVSTSFPDYYIRLGTNIFIQPRPSVSRTDGLRLTYQHRLPTLDVRRGLIASITNPSGNSLTKITLNIATTIPRDANLSLIADRTIENFDFITVVDSTGAIKMKDIPVDSYDETTGIITITPSFDFQTGETAVLGNYIVGGTNATTHSELPETCGRYLIAYAAWKILKRDSSVDLKDQERELGFMLREIAGSFAEIDEDQMLLDLDEGWII